MLKLFNDWAEVVVSKLHAKGIVANLTICVPTNNPASLLDISTPSQMARITFWESKEYFLEIMDVSLGTNTYQKHSEMKTERIFSEEFYDFFDLLGIANLDIRSMKY